MTTLEKYLIQPREGAAEPTRMTEEDALRALVSATGGAACPVHEVGVVAGHVVFSVPPDYHPGHPANGGKPTFRGVEVLVADACSLASTSLIACNGNCGGTLPLCYWNAALPSVPMVGPHPNDAKWQADVQDAIMSGDVDFAVWVLEPRLDALKMLADRARAEHGGDLPDFVAEATAVLAATLAGHTRWGVLDGMRRFLRTTMNAERADRYMQRDTVYNAVVARLILGR